MSGGKSETTNEKNKLSNSTVSAGEKVHIGDVINIYGGDKNIQDKGVEKKKKRRFGILELTLLSVTLVGIPITIKECNLITIEPNPGFNPETITTPISQIEEGSDIQNKKSVRSENERHPEKKNSEKPKFLLSDFADVGQDVKVAFLPSGKLELPAFQNKVLSRFSEQGLSISNSYFQQSFRQKFGSSVEQLNYSGLREMGLIGKLNCICQITEEITFEEGEIAEVKMQTARGKINIFILNLKTGVIDRNQFAMDGSGISPSAALESLEEHLLQSDQLKVINTQQCK